MSEPRNLKNAASDLLQIARSPERRRLRPQAKIEALRPYKDEILEAHSQGLGYRKIAHIFQTRHFPISTAHVGRAIRLFLEEDLPNSQQQAKTDPAASKHAKTDAAFSKTPEQIRPHTPKMVLVTQHRDKILEATRKGKTTEQIAEELSRMPGGFRIKKAQLARAIRIFLKEAPSEPSPAQNTTVMEEAHRAYKSDEQPSVAVREQQFARERQRALRFAARLSTPAALPNLTPQRRKSSDPFKRLKPAPQRPTRTREEELAKQRTPTRRSRQHKPIDPGPQHPSNRRTPPSAISQ